MSAAVPDGDDEAQSGSGLRPRSMARRIESLLRLVDLTAMDEDVDELHAACVGLAECRLKSEDLLKQ